MKMPKIKQMEEIEMLNSTEKLKRGKIKMSWNLNMVVDIGNERTADVFDGINYTYNVSAMYYRAFDDGNELLNIKGIRRLEGLSGEEAKPLLEKAIKNMMRKPEIYKNLNPDNGWGNYEGALSTLEQLLKWAEYAPKARFHIS